MTFTISHRHARYGTVYRHEHAYTERTSTRYIHTHADDQRCCVMMMCYRFHITKHWHNVSIQFVLLATDRRIDQPISDKATTTKQQQHNHVSFVCCLKNSIITTRHTINPIYAVMQMKKRRVHSPFLSSYFTAAAHSHHVTHVHVINSVPCAFHFCEKLKLSATFLSLRSGMFSTMTSTTGGFINKFTPVSANFYS